MSGSGRLVVNLVFYMEIGILFYSASVSFLLYLSPLSLSASIHLVYDLCFLCCLHLCLSLKMKSCSSSILFFGEKSILHVWCTTANIFLVCTNILAVSLPGSDDDNDGGVCVCLGLVEEVMMLWLWSLKPSDTMGGALLRWFGCC